MVLCVRKYMLACWRSVSVVLAGMLMFSHVYAAYNTDGLVGYWKFDESSTGTAADASGHNNHGTHVTGVALALPRTYRQHPLRTLVV